jgi:thiosulfate/3-mercaptopyruvate sulfurtransferase
MPTPANGTTYQRTLRSRRSAPTSSTIAAENIAIRWYQHNLQGVKFWTSLKYRLPVMHVPATAKAIHRAEGPIWASSVRPDPVRLATTMAIAPVAATRASNEKNRSAADNDISSILPASTREPVAVGCDRWHDAAVIPVVVDAEFVSANPKAVLADVRWYLDGRDGRTAYEAGHLPGAIWVDLDRHLAAHGLDATEGRHPLPDAADFAASMGGLGIGDDTTVVAYDDTGGLTAGRLVVMLRMLGREAAVLNGGLTAWTGPVNPGWVEPTATTFTAVPWPADRLANADQAATLAAADEGVVIDARSAERFTGQVAQIDPRPGHIPGAASAPWSAVLNADGRLRSDDELRRHFVDLGIDGTRPAIAYCGSGVSACMDIVAIEHLGLTPPRLYVASWSGWSADPGRPAEIS